MATFLQHLIWARNCAEDFTMIISYDRHNNLVGTDAINIPILRVETAETDRGWRFRALSAWSQIWILESEPRQVPAGQYLQQPMCVCLEILSQLLLGLQFFLQFNEFQGGSFVMQLVVNGFDLTCCHLWQGEARVRPRSLLSCIFCEMNRQISRPFYFWCRQKGLSIVLLERCWESLWHYHLCDMSFHIWQRPKPHSPWWELFWDSEAAGVATSTHIHLSNHIPAPWGCEHWPSQSLTPSWMPESAGWFAGLPLLFSGEPPWPRQQEGRGVAHCPVKCLGNHS